MSMFIILQVTCNFEKFLFFEKFLRTCSLTSLKIFTDLYSTLASIFANKIKDLRPNNVSF